MGKMKIFSLISLFSLLSVLFASCENFPDYTDEIKEAYRTGNHGQVIDGNMWSAVSKNELEWHDAVWYCHNLYELGYSDWELPNVDELRTLIQNSPDTETGGDCGMTDECAQQWTSENDLNRLKDICGREYCRTHEYCPRNHESRSKLDDNIILWSSTATAGEDEYALWIDFCSAGIVIGVQSYEHQVRCIRKAD